MNDKANWNWLLSGAGGGLNLLAKLTDYGFVPDQADRDALRKLVADATEFLARLDQESDR